MYERLPSRKSMVGRIVRISGQIEKSPTGPLIKLESKDHFQVLETDEAVTVERLSRWLHARLAQALGSLDGAEMTVRVWEGPDAFGAYRGGLG